MRDLLSVPAKAYVLSDGMPNGKLVSVSLMLYGILHPDLRETIIAFVVDGRCRRQSVLLFRTEIVNIQCYQENKAPETRRLPYDGSRASSGIEGRIKGGAVRTTRVLSCGEQRFLSSRRSTHCAIAIVIERSLAYCQRWNTADHCVQSVVI